jgi:hypothetical protein
LSLPQKCDIWSSDEQRQGAVSDELTKRFTLITLRPCATPALSTARRWPTGENSSPFFKRVKYKRGATLSIHRIPSGRASRWLMREAHP